MLRLPESDHAGMVVELRHGRNFPPGVHADEATVPLKLDCRPQIEFRALGLEEADDFPDDLLGEQDAAVAVTIG